MHLRKTTIIVIAALLSGSCETMPEQYREQIGNLVGVGVGVVAYGVCQNKKGDDPESQLLCAAAAVAVGYAGKLLGDKIAQHLSEREKRQVLEEAAEALETGEPQVVALPDSGGQLTITPQGNKEEKIVRTQIFVDKARLPNVDGTFVVAGDARGPSGTVNMRSGPGTTYDVVEKVAGNESVHVFGNVKDSDWLLVGYNAEDDFEVIEPVATGFIRRDVLSQASAEDLKWTDNKKLPAGAQLLELDWVTTCESSEFELESEGEITTNVSTTCAGPAGIAISS